MKEGAIAFFSALLFAIGLVVSGMTLPAKVIGFLDPFGAWDPSLALVMVGAIAVHALAYRFIKKRGTTVSGASFGCHASAVCAPAPGSSA